MHFQEKDQEVIDGLRELFIPEEVITDALGNRRWLQTVKRPICNEYGVATHVLGFATDITQRRLAEEALRRNEELLRLVTDSSPIAMVYCDDQQQLRFVNRAYVDRFGLSREDVIGRSLDEVLGPRAYESIRAPVGAALSGMRSDFEAAVPYERIGTRYMRCAYVPHIDDGGRTIGFTAVEIDITERRRMEEALRESEERLRLALGAGQMGAWDVDVETELTRWDRKAFALLGVGGGHGDSVARRVLPARASGRPAARAGVGAEGHRRNRYAWNMNFAWCDRTEKYGGLRPKARCCTITRGGRCAWSASILT